MNPAKLGALRVASGPGSAWLDSLHDHLNLKPTHVRTARFANPGLDVLDADATHGLRLLP